MNTPRSAHAHHHTLAIESALTGDAAPSSKSTRGHEKRTTFTGHEGLPFSCALLGASLRALHGAIKTR